MPPARRPTATVGAAFRAPATWAYVGLSVAGMTILLLTAFFMSAWTVAAFGVVYAFSCVSRDASTLIDGGWSTIVAITLGTADNVAVAFLATPVFAGNLATDPSVGPWLLLYVVLVTVGFLGISLLDGSVNTLLLATSLRTFGAPVRTPLVLTACASTLIWIIAIAATALFDGRSDHLRFIGFPDLLLVVRLAAVPVLRTLHLRRATDGKENPPTLPDGPSPGSTSHNGGTPT